MVCVLKELLTWSLRPLVLIASGLLPVQIPILSTRSLGTLLSSLKFLPLQRDMHTEWNRNKSGRTLDNKQADRRQVNLVVCPVQGQA